jgi:hypothetical protein
LEKLKLISQSERALDEEVISLLPWDNASSDLGDPH